ncbi:MAG: tetratricopeptide repeat protein [Polyangiaceae bacterium]|nr:tetratricopeptide repeat protein [Polyangiaceae bacterium]
MWKLPFLDACLGIAESRHGALLASAREARDRGELVLATRRYADALRYAERAFGEDDVRLQEALSSLSLLHATAGDGGTAATYGRRALLIAERSYPGEHANVIAAQENMVALLTGLLRYREAIPISERVVAALQGRANAEARLASQLETMAELHDALGRYGPARTAAEAALALRQGCGDRAALAAATNLLGIIELHDARHERAMDRFQDAYALSAPAGRTSEPEATARPFPEAGGSAMFAANVALAHLLVDRPGEAERWLKIAAARPNSTAVERGVLAEVAGRLERARDRLDEAETAWRTALDVFLVHLPTAHPRVGRVRIALAQLARERQDPRQARALGREALDALTTVLPATHPLVLEARALATTPTAGDSAAVRP